MSGVTVNVPVAVAPAPFVAVTVFEPNAVAVSSHEYVVEYGLAASVGGVAAEDDREVDRARCRTAASDVVAVTSNEPLLPVLGL